MKTFVDKVVVITGAGSGMGRAYALEFAKLGAKLALNDYAPEGLFETAELARKAGAKDVYAEAFDVSSQAAIEDFASQVQSSLGNAHIVINNAGVAGAMVPFWDIPQESWERTMNINFWGVVFGTRAFLPQLKANGEGAVVNVSSIFGLIGPPIHAEYCASKFAVRGFTECLMAELADSPISVHLVHPGGIATNITRGSQVEDQAKASAFNKQYLTTAPEAIARRVIRGIRRREPKIVYGQDSFRVWLASNFVPTRWLTKLLWREFRQKGLIDKLRFGIKESG
ncbi:SDR family NAD(P)-dependent oxidoreductase [Marinobacter mobilis]|uniref:SDR family NAD(P)-dependent oxidoreductase n=1 Tax=Marinobacter mobilis TaxID=488533 RepID=UPI0035C739AB